MSKLNLKQSPTLQDFQRYIEDMVVERGFEDETIEQLFMLLMEEVGEMARAARKLSGVKMADDTKRANLEEEVADVFIYLLDICNKFDIDLEHAFRIKEEKNKKRGWVN